MRFAILGPPEAATDGRPLALGGPQQRALFVLLLWRHAVPTLLFFVPAALVPVVALAVTNYIAIGQVRPAYGEFGGPWYTYEGSHWRQPAPGEVKYGIDWAHLKESRATYAFHVLFGHHGMFSLSPVWLLATAGMLLALRYWRALQRSWWFR